MTFRVTIVRHGQTDFNLRGVIHTWSDDTINDTGRQQAEKLGKLIKDEVFTSVYSSDLMRCQDTAKGVLGQLRTPAPPVILDQRLRERDYGSWDGKPLNYVLDLAKEKKVDPKEITPPGGETYESAFNRVIGFFQELFQKRDSSSEDENIAIFSHGLSIQFLMRYFNDNNGSKYTMKNFNFLPFKYSPNTGRTCFLVGKLDPETGKREIEFLKYYDDSHLQ